MIWRGRCIMMVVAAEVLVCNRPGRIGVHSPGKSANSTLSAPSNYSSQGRYGNAAGNDPDDQHDGHSECWESLQHPLPVILLLPPQLWHKWQLCKWHLLFIFSLSLSLLSDSIGNCSFLNYRKLTGELMLLLFSTDIPCAMIGILLRSHYIIFKFYLCRS